MIDPSALAVSRSAVSRVALFSSSVMLPADIRLTSPAGPASIVTTEALPELVVSETSLIILLVVDVIELTVRVSAAVMVTSSFC